MSILSILFRRGAARADRKRDAGLTTPAGIRRFDDICYGTSAKHQSLDVYRPESAGNRLLPVIINVHGGGWVYGDKELYQFYCMSLAEQGFAVVNFTYRLAPGHKYPAQMEDLNTVVKWMFQHGKQYGLDTGNVFLIGDSAGAHLTSLYTCICTNPEYRAHYGTFKVPHGFVPNAVALNCGIYHIQESQEQSDLTGKLMKDLLGRHARDLYEFISPVNHITRDFPPVFLMTCPGDFLSWQAPLMETALLEQEVPLEYRIYGTESEPLAHVFHCDIKSEVARECNRAEMDFFKKHIQ